MILRALLLCLATASPALALSCRVDFTVTADSAIGTVAPDDTLTGLATWDTGDTLAQEGNGLSSYSSGTLSVTDASGGAVTARIDVVHATRTPYTADYVSINAIEAAGDLGGETRYEDPMLVTLYAAPGTLTGEGLPLTERQWKSLDKRRVFQVHTPDSNAIFTGQITDLTGTCQ